jgi:glycosyltransferase involved in cell wall biosynthesis
MIEDTISIITPTYETDPNTLARTWNSLKKQTHTNWEWIIWDDSKTSNTWQQVYGFCSDERYTIKLYKSHVHAGMIGQVKRNASMVSTGNTIVELDHDDELTPNALEEINKAFLDSDVGFVYSNWCEINTSGESCRYPEGWAFGYGSDYYDNDEGVWVMRAPEINQTTLSHIVSAPNHVRAWRASTYREINGHDPSLRVADDYELVVRTCLNTKWKHIDKLLYKQYISTNTAQRVHNKEIQDTVAIISSMYSDKIKQRFA